MRASLAEAAGEAGMEVSGVKLPESLGEPTRRAVREEREAGAPGTAEVPLANNRREQLGWNFYDWANSVFPTTVVLLLGPYLTTIARASADESGFLHPLGIPMHAGAFSSSSSISASAPPSCSTTPSCPRSPARTSGIPSPREAGCWATSAVDYCWQQTWPSSPHALDSRPCEKPTTRLRQSRDIAGQWGIASQIRPR